MSIISARDIDFNRLEQLGIYELRSLARTVGVSSPTTLLRNELLERIRMLSVSESEIKRDNRGRKPKDLPFDISSVMDTNNQSTYSLLLDSDKDIAHSVQSSEKDSYDLPKTVCGFVHTMPKGHAILICADLVGYHIPPTIIAKYNLLMGDYITADISYDESIKSLAVSKVAGRDKTQRYDILPGSLPTEADNIAGIDFMHGSRILVVNSNNQSRIKIIQNSISNTNTTKVALILDENDDIANHLKSVGINEVYNSRVDNSIRKTVMVCLYAIFRAKQLAEQGNRVVLFVDNLKKLFSTYNNSGFADGKIIPTVINTAPFADLKTFFGSARALVSGGSLSIMLFTNPPNTDVEKYVHNEFINLANIIVEL
jgi:transcription termination factor Rho